MVELERPLVESNDGSVAKEYRIVGVHVEVRAATPQNECNPRVESVWWLVTPDQLSIHVECNTVVAQWLERRMGWRALLRACVDEENVERPDATPSEQL
jgi:hypothetical protein